MIGTVLGPVSWHYLNEARRRRAERVGARRRLPTGMSEAIDACLEPACGDRPTAVELADTVEQCI